VSQSESQHDVIDLFHLRLSPILPVTSSALICDNTSGTPMMRKMRRLRDYPPLPWVDPDICPHPSPVTLLKFRDLDETVFRCIACGKVMMTSEVQSSKPFRSDTSRQTLAAEAH